MARRLAATNATLDLASSNDDICPVCKTMRYLNKDLEFLINPECYHPMCKNCVSRIFAEGPNQCPHAGCHRTLRARGFRSAFFGDLSVEREVDIRRRVAAVFNKVEEDFESLADYNDYLDKVETLTDDLTHGDEPTRQRAQVQLEEWEATHRAEIERNKRAGAQADSARRQRLVAEQEAASLRQREVQRELEEERVRTAKLREEMLDGLTSAAEGARAAQTVVNRIMLKKRGHAQPGARSYLENADAPSLSIRGLRSKGARRTDEDEDPNKPYDAFGGLSLVPMRFALEELSQYHSEWADMARDKETMRVGGYSADEYVSRALFEAYSGLCVFVGEEKGGGAGVGVSLERGLADANPMDVDDVF